MIKCVYVYHSTGQKVSASEMTYIVSSGALNSTHSLTLCVFICNVSNDLCAATSLARFCMY